VVTKWLVAGVLALWALATDGSHAAADAASSRQPIALAVHVHSTLSSGSLSLEQLAAQVKTAGLDGLILTDNYDLHVEYGLWPLRGLLRYGVDYPSIRQIGTAAYLDEVRALRQRHPALLVIPGLEVMPHYFWTGSLRQGNLTVHNTQKNLLLVGLDDPKPLSAVALGGGDTAPGRVALFWPLLLAAPAAWLWRNERVVEVRTKFFQLSRRRYRRPEAIVVAAVGLLLLTNNLVLARHPIDPYGPDPADAPAQRIIDAAHAAGGLSFWSLPEAVDDHRYTMPDLAAQGGALGMIGRLLAWYGGAVSVRTNPYPASLATTTGYTGFGAIYQDQVRVTEPGGEWDRVLQAYLDGRRAAPVWGIGELAYHEEGLGRKRLTDVQTVVLAEARSAAAVVSALRNGAFYARQRLPEWGLVMDDFSLHAARTEAIAGQTAHVEPQAPVVVRLTVSASDGRSEPVTVKVIRSGRLWREFTAHTPFDEKWSDAAPPAGGRAYYRVEVGKGDQHLLSNPIFLSTVAPTG
jgi:hypothetical protein